MNGKDIMPINLIGTYVSDDLQHTLRITESKPSTGNFSGTFTTPNTTEGKISYNIDINEGGRWSYAHGEIIAGIGFMVNERPIHANFVFFDFWAGSITSAGNLLMSGSRSYTMSDGSCQIFSFEDVHFIKNPKP